MSYFPFICHLKIHSIDLMMFEESHFKIESTQSNTIALSPCIRSHFHLWPPNLALKQISNGQTHQLCDSGCHCWDHEPALVCLRGDSQWQSLVCPFSLFFSSCFSDLYVGLIFAVVFLLWCLCFRISYFFHFLFCCHSPVGKVFRWRNMRVSF